MPIRSTLVMYGICLPLPLRGQRAPSLTGALPFIHRQFFVQPGNHFPNPCLGEALRAQRMLLLNAMQSLLYLVQLLFGVVVLLDSSKAISGKELTFSGG